MRSMYVNRILAQYENPLSEGASIASFAIFGLVIARCVHRSHFHLALDLVFRTDSM